MARRGHRARRGIEMIGTAFHQKFRLWRGEAASRGISLVLPAKCWPRNARTLRGTGRARSLFALISKTIGNNVLGIIAIIFTGMIFWETFYPHRGILLIVAGQRGSVYLAPVISGQTIDLHPIITNSGNRTEIVQCICMAVHPSAPDYNQYQGIPSGPYILKPGDAVTTPITLSLDRIKTVGTGSQKDVYVRVVALGPNENIIAVDIPVTEITFTSKDDDNRYTEHPKNANKLINVFSSSTSKFPPFCGEAVQANLTITVTPGPKQETPVPNYPPDALY
jgi:hypothetical protein